MLYATETYDIVCCEKMEMILEALASLCNMTDYYFSANK